jgi:hypothetical protein
MAFISIFVLKTYLFLLLQGTLVGCEYNGWHRNIKVIDAILFTCYWGREGLSFILCIMSFVLHNRFYFYWDFIIMFFI